MMREPPLPYPEISVKEQNKEYAREILSNIGGADSEMSAIALYFYGALVAGEHAALAETFRRISVTEMRHLNIFGELALKLGADPRLWEYTGIRKRYWSARRIAYATKPRKLLTNALISEHLAVEKYTKQAKRMGDPSVKAMLERILLDEKEHIRMLTALLKEV
jgi:bacterioferritin